MSIFSTQGTREGYHAIFVPYFDSSDHRVFVEGIFGIPAVGLINMDDQLIHSSDDDLFNVDPTQMARNNFIVTALSYILAFAEKDDVPLIANETYAHGIRRLAKDLAVASRLLQTEAGNREVWKDASLIVEEGIERERRALESIRIFTAGDGKAGGIIDSYGKRLEDKSKEMAAILSDAYQTLHGSKPSTPGLSAAEQAADRRIPINNKDVDAYFTKRQGVRAGGKLQRLMQDETYNFVNGQRSYYDIYRAVRAESLVHGEWYYGPVSLEDVVNLLDAAVEAHVLTLK
jgi:hypothetical protein